MGFHFMVKIIYMIKLILMKISAIVLLLILFTACSWSQHTFSIVAVDTLTGEIGSAGATCGDSIIWPGTPGAYIISDVLPGVGAIHTQAYYLQFNQNNARIRMELGDSPDEIISYLIDNDVQNQAERRQYIVVDYNGAAPRTAGHTGVNTDDYKNHLTGDTYAVAGNILLGPQILDSMAARYLREDGCLSDKLMAAMQGANVVGADTRCFAEGTSSLSAFLRVALPNDDMNDLTLDINVAGTDPGVEPIDVLQEKYDNWKANNNEFCQLSETKEIPFAPLKVAPNPSTGIYTITMSPQHFPQTLIVYDLLGNEVKKFQLEANQSTFTLDLNSQPVGLYLLSIMEGVTIRESNYLLKN